MRSCLDKEGRADALHKEYCMDGCIDTCMHGQRDDECADDKIMSKLTFK